MSLEQPPIDTKTKTDASKVILLTISLAVATVFLGFSVAAVGISISSLKIKGSKGSGGSASSCLTDRDCRGNEFCQFETCPAGVADTGVCVRVPNTCTSQYDPVCGCDDQIYSNSCNATVAKMNIACQGTCPCPKKLIYQGNDLKIISADLIKSLDKTIIVERIEGSGGITNDYSKIYTLNNGQLTYQDTVDGYVHEIIDSYDAINNTVQWYAIAVKSKTDLTINSVWLANSLSGPWQRDYEVEKGFCYEGRPCNPGGDGSAELALVQYFNRDELDNNSIFAGPPGCEPNVSLNLMISWLQPYTPKSNYPSSADAAFDYIYFGGECPLDDAFAARVTLTRRNGKITGVNFDNSENLWNATEEQKMGNRRVGAILTQDNYVIYSGEGWIGKAPQLNPQGNWKFPVWHTQEEYLYPLGILKIDDLIIVYGFDKAKAGVSEMVELKVSRDQGDTFSSNEDDLRNYLGDLLPTIPYTMIEHMSYDETNQLIYLVINDGLDNNDLLFLIPYQELLSWL